MKDQLNCDIYELEELVKGNRIKIKEDFRLLEQLVHRGYIEANGYAWAYPRAAELDEVFKRVMNDLKKSK